MSGVALEPQSYTDQGTGVIRAESDEDDYMLSLARLDTLESECEHLTERFFKQNVLRESSYLHYLLPDKRELSITDKLRHAKTFKPLPIRTVKFRKSFIPYCLYHD